MALRQDPRLERESWGVGGQGEEVFVFGDDAAAAINLLTDNVAENASLLIYVVLLGAFQFLNHVDWQNGKGDELGMSVLQRRPGGFAMIFEDQNVFETPVLLQVEDT